MLPSLRLDSTCVCPETSTSTWRWYQYDRTTAAMRRIGHLPSRLSPPPALTPLFLTSGSLHPARFSLPPPRSRYSSMSCPSCETLVGKASRPSTCFISFLNDNCIYSGPPFVPARILSGPRCSRLHVSCWVVFCIPARPLLKGFEIGACVSHGAIQQEALRRRRATLKKQGSPHRLDFRRSFQAIQIFQPQVQVQPGQGIARRSPPRSVLHLRTAG